MTQFPSALKLDPARADQVEKRGKDLWVELEAKGHYTDVGTEIEAQLLDELQASPWEEVVTRRFAHDNPWLHRVITDRGRAVFLDLLPLTDGGTYLDVGSGWGQVAVPLSKHGNVFCLDLTLARLNILREIARQEAAPLRYLCGNFCTFPFANEQFDLVIFNGSLERLQHVDSENSFWKTQCDALRATEQILKRGGLVYVGIENSLGLKYLLEAPDDHTGIRGLTYLTEDAGRALCSQNDRKFEAKTWSLGEYRTLLESVGLQLVEAYGCFPDYKIIRQMIPLRDVNTILEKTGMPYPEHSGCDGAPLPFSDRLDHLYRLLAKNGIAEYFCPSYGLIARKPR